MASILHAIYRDPAESLAVKGTAPYKFRDLNQATVSETPHFKRIYNPDSPVIPGVYDPVLPDSFQAFVLKEALAEARVETQSPAFQCVMS